jgi:hypothetical protein
VAESSARGLATTEVVADTVAPEVSLTPDRPQRDAVWALLVGVLVLGASLVPVMFNRQFYFFADTPDGAFGQWYELGQQLLSGSWPLMNPAAWMAGNYVAEGQWGLWNPLVLGLAILITAIPSAVFSATIVKLIFLVMGALGTYALARSYRATPQWAAVAGIAAPLAGFTLFMDAPSWVTNLMVWSLFSWAVVAIRLWMARAGWTIVLAFIGCYLLITVGYVQGTLMLVLYFIAALLETVIQRSREGALRLLMAGAVAGLIAVAVYLPGLLTASVTTRSSGISNDGFMVLTLSGLATSSVPSGQADLSGWWGRFTEVPLLYIAWFLPLVLFASTLTIRVRWRELSSLALFGVLALMLAVGPAALGPLRFPARTMPWIALTAIVLTCVVLSLTGRAVRLHAGRCITVGVVSAFAYWLAASQSPAAWKQHIGFAVLTTAAVVIVWWVWRNTGSTKSSRGTGAIVATTLIVLVGQSALYADRLVSRADFPADVADYENTMPTGQGDGIVIGTPLGLPSAAFDEVAFANMWYLNDVTAVQNLYTPTEHKAYSADLCILYDGRTCYELLDRLFDRDRTTGALIVDLLSIDSIQMIADDERPIDELARLSAPAGWSQTFVGDFSVIWTRDVSTPAAGDVTWSSDGLSISGTTVSPSSVSFDVDSVPASGGTVVMSRIAWPGYSAAGATLAEPLRGYLVTVDVPAEARGERVTVSFRPPGWPLIVTSMLVSAALSVLMAVLSVRTGRAEIRSLPAQRRGNLSP